MLLEGKSQLELGGFQAGQVGDELWPPIHLMLPTRHHRLTLRP
jgi:hypothetical protein